MKEVTYPKLTEKQDRRRKLTDKDIADIKKAYEQALPFPSKSEVISNRNRGIILESDSAWCSKVGEKYNVSFDHIYVLTRSEEYRKAKIENNKENGKKSYEKRRKYGFVQNGVHTTYVAYRRKYHLELRERGGEKMREFTIYSLWKWQQWKDKEKLKAKQLK